MDVKAGPGAASVAVIDPYAVSRAALASRTRAVCTRLNRDHAELISIMTELLETSLWFEDGIRSPEHWLMLRAGLSPATARDVVRLAKRRADLPETVAAVTAGTMSLDQASVVARHVPATHSAAAADFARRCTVPQLRRALSRYSFSADDPGPDPDAAPRPATPGAEAGPNRVREDPTQATLAGRLVEVANRSTEPATVACRLRAAGRQDGRIRLRWPRASLRP